MALGYMRRHRRWLYVFLWLVIAAFIILYIPAFQGAQAGSPGETLATVGGLPITVGEFQKTYLRQRQFYERMYQGRMDPQMLKRLGLEDQVLSGLVSERLVALEAKRLGVSVDDEAVAREIASAPEYQRDGRFIGTAEIRRLLELRGLSVEEFEDAIRADLVRRRLEALVAGGVSVTDADAEREFRRRSEQIKAEYVLVASGRFRDESKASDEEVKARFEARKDDYRIPERRLVDFVLIDAEKLRPQVTVTDTEVLAEYNQRSEEFKQPEQVCGAHVLVKVRQEGAAAEGHPDAEARRIAEGLLAELKKGADFASVAKRASEDKGSAPNGGDLSCFGRGAMVPEFDQAAFDLPVGQVSDLVKTQYGYHILKISSHTNESTAPLAAVQDRLREGLTRQKLGTLAEQKAEAVAARLRRGESLAAAAEANSLKVERSVPFARAELPAPLTSQRLVARVFELNKSETEKEPFPVSQGFAFVALAEVQAPRLPELKDVQDKVRSDVENDKAQERARAVAADLRGRAEKLGLDKAAQALGLVRKETQNLVSRGQPIGDLGTSAALDDAAFALTERVLSDPLPATGGVAIVRVTEKKAFDAAEYARQKDALLTALRQQRQRDLFDAFLAEARKRVDVERRPDVMRRVVG
jgi:peptidyl-prolyl cis-trans isomerase D